MANLLRAPFRIRPRSPMMLGLLALHLVLAGSAARGERVLQFPAERSLGTLVDLDKMEANEVYQDWWWLSQYQPMPEHWLAGASGDVKVADDCRVGLYVRPRGADDDLAALAGLAPGSVELLGFDESAPRPGDRCLPALVALHGLKALALQSTDISNDGLSSLTQLASLETLVLSDQDLNTTGIRNLSGIQSLRRLRLHTSGNITAEYLSHLSQLPRLEELWLDGGIEGGGLAHFSRAASLRYLHIGGGECCPQGLEHLARIPALQKLGFYDLRPDSLALLPPMPNLMRLHIQYKGADFGPEHLAGLAGVPNLEWLSLSGSFTDDALAHLKSLKKLEHLSLSDSLMNSPDLITDVSLAHIKELRQLEFLSVYTGRFTDAGMRDVSELPRLKRIQFPNNSGRFGGGFTDAGFELLGTMKTLEEVEVRGERITDAGLAHLEGLPRLKFLNLGHRTKATTEGMGLLLEKRPGLVVSDRTLRGLGK